MGTSLVGCAKSYVHVKLLSYGVTFNFGFKVSSSPAFLTCPPFALAVGFCAREHLGFT